MSITSYVTAFAINNLVQVVVTLGYTVLWAQSGMKARDAAILGAFLALYDYVFTNQLPLMVDLFNRLADLPYAPMLAWKAGANGVWLSIGLGDLLLAVVFPLVMRKAYGRHAGFIAEVISFVTLASILLLLYAGSIVKFFPLMVVLGPLMVIQFVYWRWKRGPERTTWQYRQAEPWSSAILRASIFLWIGG